MLQSIRTMVGAGVLTYWLTLLGAGVLAHAQEYPAKPILFVIPFAAGGDSDLSGRNVGQHASKYLNNKPIVPFNRVGATPRTPWRTSRTRKTHRSRSQ